jgi:cell division protein FtsL
VIVGAMIFCVVSLQALVSQTSFRMQNLDRQSSQLRQSYGELKLEVAQLSAPGRISREAKRLGLRLPDSGHVKTLDVPGMTTTQDLPSPSAPSFALKGILGEEP